MAYTSNLVPPTPKYGSLSNSSGSLGYTSPASTALNNVQSGNTTPAAPSWQSTLTSFLGNTPPSTSPIKKIVGPDGSEIHYDNTGILGGVGQSKNTASTQNNNSSSNGEGPVASGTMYGGMLNMNNPQNGNSQLGNNNTSNNSNNNSGGGNAQLNTAISGGGTPATPGLINYGQGNANNSTVTTANQGLINTAPQAQAITDKYAGMINPITTGAIGQETGDLTTGTSPVGEGNSAVAANAAGNLIQGLTNQENTQLAGIGVQQAGYNQAGQLGTTQQGQNIGALGTVAGATQPVNEFGVAISPQTGQPITNNLSNVGNLATQGGMINSQYNAGQNAGTAAQAIGKATPIAQNLDNLIKTNNINPSNITWVNGLQNYLKTNLSSDPSITEFGGQINDLASTIAPILGIPGGATTDFKTQLGQSIVNGLQNGQSVSQSIQYFISQAAQGSLGALSGSSNITGTLNGAANGSATSNFNW